MKNLIIITMLISLTSCKLETKEEKLKRVEKNACELAYSYLSECTRVHKGGGVRHFTSCSKEYADSILAKSCEELVTELVEAD